MNIISKENNQQQQLWENKELFSKILSVAAALVIILDRKGRIVEFNQTCEESTGYEFSAIKNKYFWEFLLPSEEIKAVKQVFENIKAGDFPNLNENYINTQNGEQRLISWSNTAITNSEGEVEYIISIGIDITESRAAQAALAESEELHRSILGIISDAVFITNRSGKLSFICPNVDIIFGYSRQEVEEMGNINHILGENLFELGELEIRGEIYNIEREIKDKKGKTHTLLINIKRVNIPPLNRKGEKELILYTCRDISERKETERILAIRERYLSALVATQNRLLSKGSEDNFYSEILKPLGEASGVSRVFLCKNYRDKMGLLATRKISQWCNVGIREDSNLTDIPLEELFPKITQKLAGGEIITKILSQTSITERQRSIIADVKSLLLIPIMVRGNFYGVLGFAECEKEREWENLEIELLKSGAVGISLTIERQETEKALKRSEASLAKAQEIAHLGNWEWNINTNELYWSDEIYRIFGKQPQEFKATYEAFLNCVYPDDRELVIDAVNQAIYERKPYNIQHRILRDNEVRIIEEQGEVIWDENGQPIKMIGTVQDITKSKQLEQALRDSEQRLSNIINHTSDGILIINQAGKINFVNPSGDLIFGREKAELIDEFFGYPIAGDNLTEIGIYKPSGELIIAEMGVTEIIWEGETAYLATLRDITERKRVEIELANSLKQLQEMKYALDQSCIVLVTNVQGVITYVNDKFCEVSQYQREELIGKNHFMINSGYDKQEFFSELWQTISKGNIWRGEVKNSAKDGSCYWVDITIVPLLNEQGKPIHYLWIKHEITERKEAEKALLESEAKLRSILENAPSLITMVDGEGKIKYVNRVRQLGLTVEEIIGTNINEYLTQDSPKIHQNLLKRVVKSGKSVSLEVQSMDTNNIINYDVRIAPIVNEVQKNDGEIINEIKEHIIIATDISKQKKIENTLREIAQGISTKIGKAFFESLVEYIATTLKVELVMVGVLTTPEKITTLAWWLDENIQKNLEYDLENTPCANVLDKQVCFYPDKLQERFPLDLVLGEIGAESYLGVPLLNIEDEVIGLIAVISRKPMPKIPLTEDILQIFAAKAAAEIERRNALVSLQKLNQELEIRVKERTLELEQSKEQLQDLFDNANDLIQSVSLKDGSFIYVNRAWRETLGYSEQEKANLSIFKILHPECLAHCQRLFEQLKKGEIKQVERLEVTFLTKEGRAVILEGSINCRVENDVPVATRAIFRDVTEKKRSEAALQASENRYRILVDTARTIIIVLSPDNKILEWNQEAEKLYGYKKEEVVGEDYFLLFLPPEEQEKVAEDIKKVLAGEESRNFENIIQIKDGTERCLLWNVNIMVDENNQVIGLIACGQDITDRKQAEIALKESEERFRTVANFTADWEYWLDGARRFVYVSPSCERITGYTAQEFLDNPQLIYYIIHPEDKKAFTQYWGKEGETNLTEFRIIRRWGDIAWIENSYQSVYSEDGVWLGTRGSNREISDRKQTEAELYEREEQFRSIFENAALGVALVNIEGKPIKTNPALEKILGHTEAEIKTMMFTEVTHPEDAKVDLELYQQLITGKIDFYQIEKRYIHKDNKIVWANLTVSLVRNSQNEPQYAIAMVEDISSRKQAEKEIEKALAKERELNQLKTQFLTTASHEFRTPLTTIFGSSEFLEKYSHKLSEEKKAKHLNNIQKAANRMKQLIDDVLNVSRVETGIIKCIPVTVNLEKLVTDLINEMQTGIGKEHQINLTIPGVSTEEVALDPKIIEHILLNLLNNAIKYSPVESTIDVLVEKQENQVIFQVSDRGIGIPIEDQKNLFESFHRGKNVGNIPGTGLGLNIIKKCVDLHGGEITYISEEGKGTTFRVTIPIGH